MAEPELSVLEPPYRESYPPLGRPPAVGSIAIGRVLSQRGVTPTLSALLERAPWLVPSIVLAPALVSPVVLQGLWGLPGQPSFLVTARPAERIETAELVSAAAGRPAPPTPLLVAYVIRRTRSVVLGQTLDQAWGERKPVATADRTVRHRLRRLGDYGRHDWLRIRKLIRARTEGPGLSVELLAQSVGTEARTFRGWVRRYLGTSVKTFQSLVGWEWILETALRRGSYRLEGDLPAVRERPSAGAAV
ncbi:MAG: hypothetical protein AB7L66_01430 [Gemmatimonadales bacterium]